jgi:ribosome-associated protein
MTSKELAKIAVNALDDKKGEDITIIDISEISVLADYFIIAGGSNRSQIQAMADNVDECVSKNGGTLKQIEGYDAGNWVLLDFQDIIVHIFDKENRLFYDLERIWRDGKIIEVKDL